MKAEFINDEFISKLETDEEKYHFKTYKDLYYADVVANGICDYKNWYVIDHDNWLFTFREDEVEII